MSALIVCYNIAFFIPLLPALLALLLWKKLGNVEKLVAGMLWGIILISFSGRLWTLFVIKNNLPFFHFYILFEALLLILVFSRLHGSNWRKTKWITLGSVFSIAWLVNIAVISSMWIYPDYILGLESLLVLFLVVDWFRKMLREKIIRNPTKTFAFWMSSGLLIYFSGNFLLFLFSNFVKNLEPSVFQAIWMIHTILVILLYLMYTAALLCIPKTKK